MADQPLAPVLATNNSTNTQGASQIREKRWKRTKINITPKKKKQTSIPFPEQNKHNNKENREDTPAAGISRNQDRGSGDMPVEIDEDQVLRLISKNPRGLNFNPSNDFKISTGIEYLRDMQTGIFVAQETNTDWKQSKVKETLSNKLTKYWKHHNVTTSVSSMTPKKTQRLQKSQFLPGGTLTAVLGKWKSRVMSSGSDKTQGRWSWVRLQGNSPEGGKERNIRIVNMYRVCQKNITDSSYTSYMQQYNIQLKEGNPTPLPHQQAIIDLIAFIEECKKKGDEIILCLDANEEIQEGKKKTANTITQLVKDNALVCANKFLGHKSGTSQSSGKQIDHILVTPGILPSLIRGGFRPYAEGITSDHRALFIDFDAEILFGKGTGDLDMSKIRNLDTKYPARTEKYVKDVLDKFQKHNIFSTLEKITKMAQSREEWSPTLMKQYNTLDQTVTAIMLKCEQECNPTQFGSCESHSWSTKLTEVGFIMRYWNLRMLHLEKGNIPQAILKQVQEKAKVQTDHKETKEQILEFHRAARAELKKVQNKSEEIREQELKDRAENI